MNLRILTVILVLLSIMMLLPLSYVGEMKIEHNFCSSNFNYMTNTTNGGMYWMNRWDNNNKPFTCCVKGSYETYKRDQGTMTYFLFGKTGGYYDNVCAFIDDIEYKEPTFFKKVKVGFKEAY